MRTALNPNLDNSARGFKRVPMRGAIALVVLDALPHLVGERLRRRDEQNALTLGGQFLRKRALAGTRSADDEYQSRAHRPALTPSRLISVWGPTASGAQCIVDYLKRLKRQDIPNRKQRGHDKHGHRCQLINGAVDISCHAAEPTRRELSHDQCRRAGHGQQRDPAAAARARLVLRPAHV